MNDYCKISNRNQENALNYMKQLKNSEQSQQRTKKLVRRIMIDQNNYQKDMRLWNVSLHYH